MSEKETRSGNGHEVTNSYHGPEERFSEDDENIHQQLDAKDMYRMGKDQQFRVSGVDPRSWLEGLLTLVANLPIKYDDYVHQHGPMYLGGHLDVRGRICATSVADLICCAINNLTQGQCTSWRIAQWRPPGAVLFIYLDFHWLHIYCHVPG